MKNKLVMAVLLLAFAAPIYAQQSTEELAKAAQNQSLTWSASHFRFREKTKPLILKPCLEERGEPAHPSAERIESLSKLADRSGARLQ
jgi:hypothetical protein